MIKQIPMLCGQTYTPDEAKRLGAELEHAIQDWVDTSDRDSFEVDYSAVHDPDVDSYFFERIIDPLNLRHLYMSDLLSDLRNGYVARHPSAENYFGLMRTDLNTVVPVLIVAQRSTRFTVTVDGSAHTVCEGCDLIPLWEMPAYNPQRPLGDQLQEIADQFC